MWWTHSTPKLKFLVRRSHFIRGVSSPRGVDRESSDKSFSKFTLVFSNPFTLILSYHFPSLLFLLHCCSCYCCSRSAGTMRDGVTLHEHVDAFVLNGPLAVEVSKSRFDDYATLRSNRGIMESNEHQFYTHLETLDAMKSCCGFSEPQWKTWSSVSSNVENLHLPRRCCKERRFRTRFLMLLFVWVKALGSRHFEFSFRFVSVFTES